MIKTDHLPEMYFLKKFSETDEKCHKITSIAEVCMILPFEGEILFLSLL